MKREGHNIEMNDGEVIHTRSLKENMVYDLNNRVFMVVSAIPLFLKDSNQEKGVFVHINIRNIKKVYFNALKNE